MKITSDEQLNPQLKEEIQSLRGGIAAQIYKKVPSGLQVESCPDQPAMKLTYNGRSTIVGLCDCHGAMQVMRDLVLPEVKE